MSEIEELLLQGPTVIAIGARHFADALRKEGVAVVEVDWRPPYEPDPEAAAVLARLL